jgi:hypothetical protein
VGRATAREHAAAHRLFESMALCLLDRGFVDSRTEA